jgi:hypothetical protein
MPLSTDAVGRACIMIAVFSTLIIPLQVIVPGKSRSATEPR